MKSLQRVFTVFTVILLKFLFLSILLTGLYQQYSLVHGIGVGSILVVLFSFAGVLGREYMLESISIGRSLQPSTDFSIDISYSDAAVTLDAESTESSCVKILAFAEETNIADLYGTPRMIEPGETVSIERDGNVLYYQKKDQKIELPAKQEFRVYTFDPILQTTPSQYITGDIP
jgi:hypothetical protein